MFRFEGQSGCTVPRSGGQSGFTVPLNWGQSGLLSLTTRDTWSLLSLVRGDIQGSLFPKLRDGLSFLSPKTKPWSLFVSRCEGFHG